MTDDRMRKIVSGLVDDARLDAYTDMYLDIAKSKVISRVFPYRDDAAWADVPEKYHGQTCEIAVYLINRRGSEGEMSHSENGVARTYSSAGVPETLLDGILPFVGVPG